MRDLHRHVGCLAAQTPGSAFRPRIATDPRFSKNGCPLFQGAPQPASQSPPGSPSVGRLSPVVFYS